MVVSTFWLGSENAIFECIKAALNSLKIVESCPKEQSEKLNTKTMVTIFFILYCLVTYL